MNKKKEIKLIEIKNIEKERDFFDNMSYIEKIKYKLKKNKSSYIYVFLLEFSALLFAPIFFISMIISFFFSADFHKGIINSFLIGLSPFFIFMSLYFITMFFNNIIFVRPNFEKKLYYKIKDVYEISEEVSGEEQNKAISEINNADFFDEEILSWETRDVLREIRLNEKDIGKIKEIGLQYELTPKKDLLDLYFLIRKNGIN